MTNDSAPSQSLSTNTGIDMFYQNSYQKSTTHFLKLWGVPEKTSCKSNLFSFQDTSEKNF